MFGVQIDESMTFSVVFGVDDDCTAMNQLVAFRLHSNAECNAIIQSTVFDITSSWYWSTINQINSMQNYNNFHRCSIQFKHIKMMQCLSIHIANQTQYIHESYKCASSLCTVHHTAKYTERCGVLSRYRIIRIIQQICSMFIITPCNPRVSPTLCHAFCVKVCVFV